MAAGLKVDPPIVVARKKPPPINLSNIDRKQKFSQKKSGRKRPRDWDYMDLDFNLDDNGNRPSCASEEISKVLLNS